MVLFVIKQKIMLLELKKTMKQFPQNLCDQAVADVHNIYNTDAMAKKYVNFYNDAINGKYE